MPFQLVLRPGRLPLPTLFLLLSQYSEVYRRFTIVTHLEGDTNKSRGVVHDLDVTTLPLNMGQVCLPVEGQGSVTTRDNVSFWLVVSESIRPDFFTNTPFFQNRQEKVERVVYLLNGVVNFVYKDNPLVKGPFICRSRLHLYFHTPVPFYFLKGR